MTTDSIEYVHTCQHTDNWQKYFFDTLHRTPTFWTWLVAHGIIAGSMQYRYAYATICINLEKQIIFQLRNTDKITQKVLALTRQVTIETKLWKLLSIVKYGLTNNRLTFDLIHSGSCLVSMLLIVSLFQSLSVS